MVKAAKLTEYQKCEAVCDYFKIDSIDTLLCRMPYILTHDFQTGINGKRKQGSLAGILMPSKTVDYVYNKVKDLGGVYADDFPSNEELKTMKFSDTCSDGKYESVIVTCLQQACFARDMINNYLRFKENKKEKAGIVNVDLFRNGVKLYGHFVVGFSGKLYETSSNVKFEGVDITDLPVSPKVLDAGFVYVPKYSGDYPIDLDWKSWMDLKARKKLKKLKEKNRIVYS